jgi:hypothetical protein
VILITASEHKGWLARHFSVQRSTRTRTDGVGKKFDISTYHEWAEIRSDHEVDAANVAKYAHDYKLAKLQLQKEKHRAT